MRLPVDLRAVPIGVLLIAALFGLLGLGATAGGLYLLMEDGALRPWAATTALLMGPLLLYLAGQLMRMAPWAWLALMVLMCLLFASSVLRFVFSPGLMVAPLVEIVLEVTAVYYLSRPGVRAAFGRPTP